jgi:ABC-type multidrug transport system ATPase subunit
VSGAPVAAWDNSTRGLDSASALEFAKGKLNQPIHASLL